jgi:hypothetical protein
METFAPLQTGLENDFGRENGSLGTFSGHEQGDRSDAMSSSFELLTDISPHTAPMMEFNLSDGAPSEHSFAFDPSVLGSFTQMSQDFVEDNSFQHQNYLLMSTPTQFLPGSNGSFAQQNNISMMPFDQQAQTFTAQFVQSGT